MLSKLEDLESLFFMMIYLLKGSLPWGRTNIEDNFRKEARLKIKTH
jgi:hypothetical protein